ncbi:Cyclic nucleotide-binding protein [Pseudocohnilembus persalinus]|uniref:Cyclic nucleotide-binding protein n=1 Tax=Pseudocohnilembus persalinus TaxID=266149 RepID=A0A0V0QAP9_PSEPJ|nr:Cyclic nucleotide-binding protein [Pseudocohnilembus persalinus]|eukprot:KRW99140.1 Cyclic nucleotide-binding protein [Pseudocohnilembus persalinus]
MIVIMAHFFGCIFLFLANQQIEQGNQKTWLHIIQLENGGLVEKYTATLYFAFVSMMTIGYGDIYPNNSAERIYVIFMSLFSCGLFGYSVNKIGNIFSEHLEQENKLKHEKFQIISYLNERNASSDLSYQIIKNYEQIQKDNTNSTQLSVSLLKKISPELYNEFKLDFYGNLLKQQKTLSLNFSEKLLSQLSLNFKEKIYRQGEVIIDKGEIQQNLSILIKGSAKLKHVISLDNKVPFQQDINQSDQFQFSNNEIDVGQLQQGNLILFENFLCNLPSKLQIKSAQTTKIAYISLSDFNKIIKNFQSDLENLQKLKDDIFFHQKQIGNGYLCDSCYKLNHSLQDCPFIHYKPKKLIVLFNHNLSEEHILRQKFQRRDQARQGTLEMLPLYQQRLKHLRYICVQHRIQDEYLNLQFFEQCQDFQFYQYCPAIKNNIFKPEIEKYYLKQYSLNLSQDLQDLTDHYLEDSQLEQYIIEQDYLQKKFNKLSNAYSQDFEPSVKRMSSKVTRFQLDKINIGKSSHENEKSQMNLKKFTTYIDEKQLQKFKESTFFIILDFDKQKIFEKYQLYNNYPVILQKYKRYQQNKLFLTQNNKSLRKLSRFQGEFTLKTTQQTYEQDTNKRMEQQIEINQQNQNKQVQDGDDDDGNSVAQYILLGLLACGFLFFLYNTYRCQKKKLQDDEFDDENDDQQVIEFHTNK